MKLCRNAGLFLSVSLFCKTVTSETMRELIEQYIEQLQLQPHPEGGYYSRSYASAELIAADALPERFTGDRCFSTAIYFLLAGNDFSAFHRIKSDELWHFYAGDCLQIYVLHPDGRPLAAPW